MDPNQKDSISDSKSAPDHNKTGQNKSGQTRSGQEKHQESSNAAPAIPALTDKELAAYLSKNPQFLADFLPEFFAKNPNFLQKLRLPGRELGPDIVDFRQILIEKLQTELADLRQTQRKMITVARHNLVGQNRVHQAILTLMRAQSFEELVQILTEELASLLDVDAVAICVEDSLNLLQNSIPSLTPQNAPPPKPRFYVVGEEEPPPPAIPPKTTPKQLFDPNDPSHVQEIYGVRILSAGTIQKIMGESKILLRADLDPEAAALSNPIGHFDSRPFIYGAKNCHLVRSDALARLDFNGVSLMQGGSEAEEPTTITGLLAMGARRPGVYHPGQDIELVAFLAEFMVANVQRWLAAWSPEAH